VGQLEVSHLFSHLEIAAYDLGHSDSVTSWGLVQLKVWVELILLIQELRPKLPQQPRS
jgi:hypothetical protein